MFILLSVDELCQQPLIQTVLGTIKTIFDIIKIGVPLFLIILCAIDLFKAMTSGDEKKQQEARKTIVRRLIYAVIIFLLIPILSLILDLISNVVQIDDSDAAKNSFSTFLKCWNYEGSTTTGGAGNTNTGNSDTCVCINKSTSAYMGTTSRSWCEDAQSGGYCAD